MKKHFLIPIMAVVLLFSCKNLNIPPYNIVQDQDIFNSESGVDAYFASMYNNMKVEDFMINKFDAPNQGWFGPSNFDGEALQRLDQDGDLSNPNLGDGTYWPYWGFNHVRAVNQFLESFPKYTAKFTKAKADRWTGEAYFLRAYYYFSMVKRYGGVPIVKSVQNFTGANLDELRVPRDKEEDVYNFIDDDLTKAIALMPETEAPYGKARANKNTAYALRSRAMLYAGTIAKYGTVQLNGLIGIPAASANAFLQKSVDAAKALQGKYPLGPDYGAVFNVGKSDEFILDKEFVYPNKTHWWDALHFSWTAKGPSDYAGCTSPSLDLVEEYEYVDGTPGKLKMTDGTGKQIEYDKPTDLFAGKDPRMFATVVFPYDTFKGLVIPIRKGVIVNGVKYVRGDEAKAAAAGFTGGRIDANDGLGESTRTGSGFYIRKFMWPNVPSADLDNGKSTQPWPTFRYGEILMNRAEASFELSDMPDALYAINEIRKRAGIRQLLQNELTIDRIRNERRVELALENHTYWDLRRWRTFAGEFNGRKIKTLLPYFDFTKNKWVFESGTGTYTYTFPVSLYYEKIPTAEIAKNNKLIQNPGY